MRVSLIFAWVVMTMGVTALSHDRPKRDLFFIKKILESLLGVQRSSSTEEHSRLYKIPGFDVVLKVSPRQSIKETEIINQVKRLLNLEVLSEEENEEIQEFIVPLTANKRKYITEGKDEIYSIRSPVSTTKVINFAPNIKREPVTIEVPPTPIKPTHVKVSEIFRPKYSYKQTAKDGSITTFKSEGDQNIIVTEIETIPALPPYIQFRLEDVVAKCITRAHCSRPIIDNQFLPFPRYESLGISVPNPIAPSTYMKMDIISASVPPPLMVERVEHVDVVPDTFKKLTYSPSYRMFKDTKYLVGQDFDGTFIVKEENPVLKKTTVTTLSKEGSKGVGVNINGNRNNKINNNKSYKEIKQNKIISDHKNLRDIAMSGEGTSNSYSIISNKIHSNSEPRLSVSKGDNLEKNHNFELINERTNSQFSYKQTKRIVPAREEIKPKVVDDKIKLADESDTITSNYLYIPTTIMQNRSTSTRTEDDENDSNIQNLFSDSKTTTETAEIEYSFEEMPIIIPDDIPYAYKPIKHDGSSMITRQNLQNVSIESNTNEENDNISDIIF